MPEVARERPGDGEKDLLRRSGVKSANVTENNAGKWQREPRTREPESQRETALLPDSVKS